MRQYAEHGGLYATTFDLNTGRPMSNTYSIVAMADSAYEFFLKAWLLTGRTEQKYLDMCKPIVRVPMSFVYSRRR